MKQHIKFPLTDKQDAMYMTIRDYIESNGEPPTRREIMALTGLKSTAAVSVHITALEKKNWIAVLKHTNRGIVLL